MRYIFLILLFALSILFVINAIVLRFFRVLPFFKPSNKTRRNDYKNPNILYQDETMTIYKGDSKDKMKES
ncbi:MAG: hypothetical protein ACUVQ1_00870 [Candidatus Kapaibacteriales bacterium]